MNYKKLVEQFLWDNEEIRATMFFTAYYTENIRSPRYQRHKLFTRALIEQGISIILGNFISKEKTVYKESILRTQPTERYTDLEHIESLDYRTKEEKKTDVNLAVRLVEDAYEDRFDIAYIISCDTDIVPAVSLIKQKFPEKRLVNLRIANSIWRDIQRMCHACVEVSSKHIEYALMERDITTKDWVVSMPPDREPKNFEKLL